MFMCPLQCGEGCGGELVESVIVDASFGAGMRVEASGGAAFCARRGAKAARVGWQVGWVHGGAARCGAGSWGDRDESACFARSGRAKDARDDVAGMEWGGGGCDKKSQGEGKKVRGERQHPGSAADNHGVSAAHGALVAMPGGEQEDDNLRAPAGGRGDWSGRWRGEEGERWVSWMK